MRVIVKDYVVIFLSKQFTIGSTSTLRCASGTERRFDILSDILEVTSQEPKQGG